MNPADVLTGAWWSMTGLLAVTAAGCSDAGVVYGPPGGLSGKTLPSPTQPLAGAAGTPDGGGAPGDGGGHDGGGAPDGSAHDAGAREASAPLASDAGACSVSWSAQIFPNMAATGRWRCGDSSCHGGFQSPKVTSDPGATYASFAAFTMTPPAPALPFVLAGSTDPGQSGIECNLASTRCGPEMPLTQAGAQPLTQADVALLDTWVKCGAPDN